MSKVHVVTSVNGEPREMLCEPQQSLLEVLRDELGMTGTKEGCATGDCGACSVMIDGRLVCSCLMLGVEAEGVDITTIEGIAEGSTLHPVQRKFLEHAALQCGICTPGFIVATKALLDRNPDPDERTIRYWLAGNLCRCTGYDKIVRAVQDAAAELAHEA
ncbi:MAG: (2Fe-2S)-binding protein [Gammaproteobacteria bacterium]|nr:(2Fe-2S)-binding protein [Gammaproteobacteria bacterium]